MKEIKTIKLKNRELENKPNIMMFHNGFTEYKDGNKSIKIARTMNGNLWVIVKENDKEIFSSIAGLSTGYKGDEIDQITDYFGMKSIDDLEGVEL